MDNIEVLDAKGSFSFMEWSGSLEDRNVASLLMEIHEHAWSGTLQLQVELNGGPRSEYFLLFSEGRLLTCLPPNTAANLATEMIRFDVLPASRVQEALKLCQEREERIERLILREDWLDEEQLQNSFVQILAYRIRPLLYHESCEGTYSFQKTQGEQNDPAMSHLALGPDELFISKGVSVFEILEKIRQFEYAGDSEEVSGNEVTVELDPPLEVPEPEEIQGALSEPPGSEGADFVDLSSILGFETTEISNLEEDDMSFLNAMLNELNHPQEKVDISLLLLRYASQVFTRGVLFRVEDDSLKSVGEFGFDTTPGASAEQIREKHWPLNESGLFFQVIEGKQLFKAPLEDKTKEDEFFRLINDALPKEIFVAPVFSQNRPMALLYGDYGPEQPLGENTIGLEIFLSQVGLTLEKEFLMDRIEELQFMREDEVLP